MKFSRFWIGQVPLDCVSLEGALGAIEALVDSHQGGAVLTPNIHHVIWTDKLTDLEAAYRSANLCLVDDTPLYWLTALLGGEFPEKVSGSDLIDPLMARAAKKNWRVFLFGAQKGIGEKAAKNLLRLHPGLKIVGIDNSEISLDPNEPANRKPLAAIQKAKPDLLLVALGCPKQELWIKNFRQAFSPAVAIGIGAGLDFLSGHMKRAPRFLSAMALEGAYRIWQEPRRLWYRYLIESPQVIPILLRTLRRPPAERIEEINLNLERISLVQKAS